MEDRLEKSIELSAPVERVWRALTDSREFGEWFLVKMEGPYAVDPQADYSQETPTLVEFRLEAIRGGTLLTVTESGFAKLPKERYADAFRMNNRGWEQQLEHIEAYVSKAS